MAVSPRSAMRLREHGLSLALVLPAAVLLALVLVVPICIALWSSLFSLNILNLADQRFELQAGEALTFDAARPHRYTNTGTEAATYLASVTPPTP